MASSVTFFRSADGSSAWTALWNSAKSRVPDEFESNCWNAQSIAVIFSWVRFAPDFPTASSNSSRSRRSRRNSSISRTPFSFASYSSMRVSASSSSTSSISETKTLSSSSDT
eukprot:Amastigsp_a342504_49.p4 type:complete len:112 gc:universal Amastigsp_a342504_49:553-218(-)